MNDEIKRSQYVMDSGTKVYNDVEEAGIGCIDQNFEDKEVEWQGSYKICI
jgi:hypothetical protein